MNGKIREWFRNWRWALVASLFLHALVAAFLLYGLPRPEQQPDDQQPVNVAIVPPPDQPKPKPPPKAEKPPEPKAEKPPEQKVEKPPPPEPPKPPDIPVLKRVFQYGEKDTGPEKSLDGGSAQANTPQPAKDAAAKSAVEPKPTPNPPANSEQQPDSSKADEKQATAAPNAKPTPSEAKQATENADAQQPDKQEPAPQAADKQAADAPKPLAAEAGDKPAPPSSAEKAKAKPAKPMKFKSARALRAPSSDTGRSNPNGAEVAGSPIYSGLPGVRKLYSQGATGNALATSSMENVPRDQRVANLCANVLNQELQSADYSPKWLPTIPLKQGNVLNPPQAAFSTTTQWFDLSFRCEVDTDATRVLSFNFRVGGLVPPGEWTRRRFPSLR